MTKLALDTETNGFTATVEHDPHGADESPREWAMESVFFGFHRYFASPDSAPGSDPETARDIATANDNICLPVWLYAHGGTCYRAAEKILSIAHGTPASLASFTSPATTRVRYTESNESRKSSACVCWQTLPRRSKPIPNGSTAKPTVG